MKSTMKFNPGNFVEIDDLAGEVGSRKVVLVCKDGVTFWDLFDAKESTPLVFHPSINPKDLGTFTQFGPKGSPEKVIAFLRKKNDPRVDTDPLFVMRMLWFAVKKSEINDENLSWAFNQTEIQQKAAARIHQYAEQYSVLSQSTP